MRMASFIGWSGSGKTGFIEACLRELHGRGLAAAVVKRTHHAVDAGGPAKETIPSMDAGRNRKDTSRFMDAGADAALVSDETAVAYRRPPEGWDRAWVEELFPGADAVLLEGRVVAGSVAVLVAGPAGTELKRPLREFEAVVSDDPALAERAADDGVAVYGPGEAARFVDAYLAGGIMDRRDVTLEVNGMQVPLNAFVEETVANVVAGLLKGLKGVDPDGDITLRVSRKR